MPVFEKMVKIIFFDVDGTLISLKNGSIPVSTKAVINQLRQKGLKVVLATGRAYKDIITIEDIDFDGFITSNGACCIDSKGEIMSQRFISKESLVRLARYLEEKPFPCEFSTDKGTFINYVNDEVVSLCHLLHLPVPPLAEVAHIIENEVMQLGVFVDSITEKKLISEVLPDCESSRWTPVFADINVKNCDKASGVDQFLTHFGIEREFTIAFGDGENDISMLKHVAIGIAMNNASDEVKKAADYVTGTIDDNGIVNALHYFGVI